MFVILYIQWVDLMGSTIQRNVQHAKEVKKRVQWMEMSAQVACDRMTAARVKDKKTGGGAGVHTSKDAKIFTGTDQNGQKKNE